jgi:hypothetical protein
VNHCSIASFLILEWGAGVKPLRGGFALTTSFHNPFRLAIAELNTWTKTINRFHVWVINDLMPIR